MNEKEGEEGTFPIGFKGGGGGGGGGVGET